jgi:hypothetical protein
MTQTDLNREVAGRTGESNRTIRRRGFSLLEIPCPPPLVVDWDELDALRAGMLPERQCRFQLVG